MISSCRTPQRYYYLGSNVLTVAIDNFDNEIWQTVSNKEYVLICNDGAIRLSSTQPDSKGDNALIITFRGDKNNDIRQAKNCHLRLYGSSRENNIEFMHEARLFYVSESSDIITDSLTGKRSIHLLIHRAYKLKKLPADEVEVEVSGTYVQEECLNGSLTSSGFQCSDATTIDDAQSKSCLMINQTIELIKHGFETGPGNKRFIAGISPEADWYLQNKQLNIQLTIGQAQDQNLPYGPINCNF